MTLLRNDRDRVLIEPTNTDGEHAAFVRTKDDIDVRVKLKFNCIRIVVKVVIILGVLIYVALGIFWCM